MEKKCHHCSADLSETFYVSVLGCSTVDLESTPPKSLPVPEGTPEAFCCLGDDVCRNATTNFIGKQSTTKEITIQICSNVPKMTKKERIDLCVSNIDTILKSCNLDETNQYRWDYLKKQLESVV